MSDILTENDIESILKERKTFTDENMQIPPNLKRAERNFVCKHKLIGNSGNQYILRVRKALNKENNFSVILTLKLKSIEKTLVRYNGDWHRHTNKIEKEQIRGYHIHKITERYQSTGLKSEGFAQSTRKYNNWESAYWALIRDFNITTIKNINQTDIFDFVFHKEEK